MWTWQQGNDSGKPARKHVGQALIGASPMESWNLSLFWAYFLIGAVHEIWNLWPSSSSLNGSPEKQPVFKEASTVSTPDRPRHCHAASTPRF